LIIKKLLIKFSAINLLNKFKNR